MKITLPLLVVVLFTGCAPHTYLAYQGKQQDWPISDHAFVREMHGVTLYRGLPPRPYIVLGYLNFHYTAGLLDMNLAYYVRHHGADAAILEEVGEEQGQTTTVGSVFNRNGDTVSTSSSYTSESEVMSVRLIRFVDPPHVEPLSHPSPSSKP